MDNKKLLTKEKSSIPKNLFEKITFQIRLLLWKRYAESTKNKWDLLKVIAPAVLIFLFLILIYGVITNVFSPDGLEPFFVPFAFWMFMQRILVHVMYEKSTRLQESMRMMGLSDFAYWVSYFISDGIILGFVLSFLCAILTVGGLFNGANFGVLLGFFFIFCLSAIPFCFFVSAFFDTPQTCGQAFLAILLGFYVLYVVVFVVGTSTISLASAQSICCLIPPLALQIGSGAFLNSYDGISMASICGIMFADIFIYTALAWYFSQVWPSKVGIPKPFYFIFEPSYWFPKQNVVLEEVFAEMHAEKSSNMEEVEESKLHKIPIEDANEALLGKPTVVVKNLRKTFGSQLAVSNLSFKMYENQIFALLGHNGAGKTTTISMLTGLFSPDYATQNSGAFVYGHNIHDEMDIIRYSLGVCPQHDVLFENLTVREHILFFAQLKGFSLEKANKEAETLTDFFHLDSRLDHTGNELSGGQKRKLSVAIAICGGSKFVVLDEPTAGMDPLARRELWDLLAALRKGRTMLLTTHYMDESEVLGDRVGIMSLGQMQCLGTPQFLKTSFGAGYKLIFDKPAEFNVDALAKLTAFIQSYIAEAKYFEEDGSENQIMYSLPFNTVSKFGDFFNALEVKQPELEIANYGVTITSLEDVFLKVGGDHTVTPNQDITNNLANYGIGKVGTNYSFSLTSQIIGLAKRKLTYAINDFITLPLILLPICASIAAVTLYNKHTISSFSWINDLVASGMFIGAYFGAPGLIAEFVVRERNDKLRNVLTVMGCDFRAYWIGTFLADYVIMFIPTVCLWIMWPAANMPDFYSSDNGLCFWLLLIFNIQLIAFSYFFSFVFSSPKSCITLMPIIILVLILTPNVIILILIEIAQAFGTSISSQVVGGSLLWGLMLMTPHGALFAALLDTTQDYSKYISNFPPVSATIVFMLAESVAYLSYAYYIDSQSVAVVPPIDVDPAFDPKVLENLDEDVQNERDRTLNLSDPMKNDLSANNDPLRICRLRKVFPPKRQGQRSVIATEDVAFQVKGGEIFGLLGANGAGKTTTLSMLTRHLVPTSGNAFIAGHSILTDFSKGSTHLGVVTQNNSLWDRLSVEAHLKLFARLRGVPEDQVYKVVDATIDQLELTPHRKKLAMKLSGGMKRKLCVAIALIGDPEVVLLDEPSAGLDPVSRRNLWSVILRTMSQRAVILTTHSMEEAEALCQRIAIMVKGQIRALGTKQHLKYKFGSGYELSVKLHVNLQIFDQQLDRLSNFVNNLFPSSTMLAENGGLVTYQIPRDEMHMGKAFSALEVNKTQLEIEDYTIAQPTLEQVFIRTVNKYSEVKNVKAGLPTVLGGTARLSVEGTALIEGQEAIPVEGIEAIFEEVVLEKNKCGCTNYCVKIMVAIATLFVLIFIGSAFAIGRSDKSASSGLWAVGTISLIVAIVGCNILCCACCQNPKGADE